MIESNKEILILENEINICCIAVCYVKIGINEEKGGIREGAMPSPRGAEQAARSRDAVREAERAHQHDARHQGAGVGNRNERARA